MDITQRLPLEVGIIKYLVITHPLPLPRPIMDPFSDQIRVVPAMDRMDSLRSTLRQTTTPSLCPWATTLVISRQLHQQSRRQLA